MFIPGAVWFNFPKFALSGFNDQATYGDSLLFRCYFASMNIPPIELICIFISGNVTNVSDPSQKD